MRAFVGRWAPAIVTGLAAVATLGAAISAEERLTAARALVDKAPVTFCFRRWLPDEPVRLYGQGYEIDASYATACGTFAQLGFPDKRLSLNCMTDVAHSRLVCRSGDDWYEGHELKDWKIDRLGTWHGFVEKQP